MSTTFTWNIESLERVTASGLVYNANYTVVATDDVYKSSAYGTVAFDAPAEGDSIIPYSDLNPDTVIGWVKAKLGGPEKVAEIEATLQARLDEQHAPSIAAGIPWSQS